MRHNHLTVSVLQVLKEACGGLSEYELMRRLEILDTMISGTTGSYQLAMFRKHFVVMNALYSLQAELVDESVYLHISALDIHLRPSGATASSDLCDPAQAKLRDYYLNWKNYDETGEDDVQQLLDAFWLRYAAVDKQQLALRILGLETGTDWPVIRDCYRRLAMQHHPDKGGDERKFIEVREAYEILRCSYERT